MPQTPRRAAKAKRPRAPVVMYVRVRPEDRALITKIAEERGYPHTAASVAGEVIARGLKTEAPATTTETPA